MKTNVNEYDFLEAFRRMNRDTQFSRGGLFALYDWLIDLEQDIEEEIELDVIALCCDFAEYDDLKEYNEAYGTAHTDENYEEEISDYTYLITGYDENKFIIQQW
jgi:hypothetical protein